MWSGTLGLKTLSDPDAARVNFKPVPATVSQLVALGRPDIKGLLCQIASVRLHPRQAERKLIQRTIVTGHQALKIQAHGFGGAVILVGLMSVPFVPASLRKPLKSSSQTFIGNKRAFGAS